MSITSINSFDPLKNVAQMRVKATVSDVPTTTIKAPTPDVQEAQPNDQEMEAAVDNLNKVIASSLQSIQFSMDKESGKVVVKVLDSETKQVLRQIPNPEVLAISKNLARLQGLFVSDRV